MSFQGNNWVFTFPYTTDKAADEVYQVVNTAFTTRARLNGYPTPQLE